MLRTKRIFTLYYLHIFYLLCLSPFTLLPQTNYNLKTISSDFESLVLAPKSWDNNDLIKFVGISGLTYAAMHVDEYILEQVLNNHSYRNSIPVEFGRIWGEPWLTGVLAGGFYIHGMANDNNGNKRLGFEIGESAIFTSLATLLLKISFGRERPRLNSEPFSFHPFSFKSDNFLSFSSGHTALAFSLSTILASNTENNYLKVIFYIPAFMTAFSRVYQNHHWFSDVLFGGVVGFSIAKFVTGIHKVNNHSAENLTIHQNPIPLVDFKIPL
ncbi:MAG: phosphatase PAP2 family protein [Melioribacteraceae bacterium]|nr:phosphatase PAP2 family protein [Melioribacteraceae bacterium]